jgi:hypothetical protein
MRIPPGSKVGQWAATLLVAVWFVTPAFAEPAAKARVMVQTTLTAGLAHHEAKAVWDDLQDGDPLDLVREADNPHDPHAVRVDWGGHVLGYLPQADNLDIARQLDRGQFLKARILKRAKYRNHRRKLEIEIYAEM